MPPERWYEEKVAGLQINHDWTQVGGHGIPVQVWVREISDPTGDAMIPGWKKYGVDKNIRYSTGDTKSTRWNLLSNVTLVYCAKWCIGAAVLSGRPLTHDMSLWCKT